METVESNGRVRLYCDLVLDAFGNPHISYFDVGNGELKYARWTGSSWQIEVVDVGGVGQDPSISLDAAGNPHITYNDYTNFTLKYARWTGSTWQILTVDIGGLWTSIAVDASDNPHISHYSSTTHSMRSPTGGVLDLKYASTAPGGAMASVFADRRFDIAASLAKRETISFKNGKEGFRFRPTTVANSDSVLGKDGSMSPSPVRTPANFSLRQNYPNPFNPSTEISFSLSEASNVRLEVFNIMGRRVGTVVNRRLEAGNHTVIWDGNATPSGVYFYRLQAGKYVERKRMLLLK